MPDPWAPILDARWLLDDRRGDSDDICRLEFAADHLFDLLRHEDGGLTRRQRPYAGAPRGPVTRFVKILEGVEDPGAQTRGQRRAEREHEQ